MRAFILSFFTFEVSIALYQILNRTKNVPWHILAERFLLYRKAISCKAKKRL